MFIWDIEQVLHFIRGMSNNTELSDSNIKLKLEILLFLTLAGQCHDICYVDIIKFIVRKSSSFKFSSSPKLQNVGGKGNLHNIWSFINIVMMKNCV